MLFPPARVSLVFLPESIWWSQKHPSPMKLCPLCGIEVPVVRIGRPRKFCSDACRERYKSQRRVDLCRADALESQASDWWVEMVGMGIVSDELAKANARDLRSEAADLRAKWTANLELRGLALDDRINREGVANGR